MERYVEPFDYLPPVMQEVREIQEIYNGLGPEIRLFYVNAEEARNECFVLNAVGEGLERWERMLKIKLFASDTFEDRRLRILARLNGDTPYTFEKIYNKLKILCGEKNVSMDYTKEIYTLRVIIKLEAKNQFKTVIETLREMLPCNISLICNIAYNTHKVLKKYPHCELKPFTHSQLREHIFEEV